MPRFLAARRGKLFALLLLVTLVQLASALGVSGLVSGLFRHLLAGQDPGNRLAWLLALAIVATAGSELARRLLTEALGLDYARDVRLALFERLLRRPVRSGRTRSRGSQLLPFVGDLAALRLWWSDGIARGSSAVLIALGICAWLFRNDTSLGLWLTGLALTALALMAAIAGPFFLATRSQRAARGTLTALLSDRIAAAHSVMALGAVQRELNQTRSRIDRMNRASLRRAGWSGAMRGLLAAFPLAGVLVLVFLSRTDQAGIPAHDLVGLLTLLGVLGGALADIGRALELAIPAQIATRRLRARLDEIDPLVTQDKEAGERKPPILALDGLALTSRGHGFTGLLARGDILALEGRHASLLIEMLAGMERAAQGQALICGHPAIGLGQRQRRQWLGIAAPWTPLLQDGLAENLLLRMRRGSGQAELPGLMQALGIGHLLDECGAISPQRLRDDGANLERRERAAIRIVRAMIGQPRLLLLDQTSHDLDAMQLTGLRDRLQDWPGVVVLAGERPELATLATHRWTVSGGRIAPSRTSKGDTRHVAAIRPLKPVPGA